jgi:NitT/TauT family transport system ATP-binding protein
MAAPLAPIISIDGLTHRFPGSDEPTLADLTLTLGRGEFVAIVGGSGVGKSTLLRAVAGLIVAGRGVIDIHAERTPGRRRRAMVFQDARLMPWRRVAGNVAFGLEGLRIGAEERARRIAEVLRLTGLEELADRWPHQLSGGQVQRVGIARALAVRPDILLMDEPFSAVDALTRRHLQSELLRIWQAGDAAILFVTHDIDEAVVLADRVIVLSGRPATISHEAVIDLPRPRRRDGPDLYRRSTDIAARLEAPDVGVPTGSALRAAQSA